MDTTHLFFTNTNRIIRVFISSTFKDLEDEREYLIKAVFPELKKYCREREISFTEIDLRWGITEEESQKGKVVEVCLREIERTRPYFIGILGDRYGWIPDKTTFDEEILANYEWLLQDTEQNLSITEIEIQYGVLRNKIINHGFFYFREVSEKMENRLQNLKETIKNSGFPIQVFCNKQELGNYIFEDLKNTIDKNFSEIQKTVIENERNGHAIFAQSRLFPNTVYIPNNNNYQYLDEHFISENQPLVVTGASGTGKSALIANWLQEFHKKNPNTFVFYHFVGSTPESTNYENILRRLVNEIKQHFNIEREISQDINEVQKTLPDLLTETGDTGNWLLVVDGLNQLYDNHSKMLNWLPRYFPTFIRVILSTTTGETLDILKRHNYQIFEIPTLSHNIQQQFIEGYLNLYGKKLSDNHIKKIEKNELFSNAIALKTLLDELRIFGYYEKLDEEINRYLQAQTDTDFFDKVITRYEKDYNFDNKKYVEEFLLSIYIANKGLSETEILEITQISPVYWSQLYNAVEPHLISHNGILTFSHDQFRLAVQKHFLQDFKKEMYYAQKLIKYFEKEPFSSRSISELPSLYDKMEKWETLCEYITSSNVLLALNEDTIVRYLNILKSKIKIENIAKNQLVFNNYTIENYNHITSLCRIMIVAGLNNVAIKLGKSFLNGLCAIENISSDAEYIDILCDLYEFVADLCVSSDMEDDAIEYYSKVIAITEFPLANYIKETMKKSPYLEFDADSFYLHPNSIKLKLKLAKVEKGEASSKLLRSIETFCKKDYLDILDQIHTHRQIGEIYFEQEAKKEAEISFEKSLELCKTIDNPYETINTISCLANLYSNENPSKAIELYDQLFLLMKQTIAEADENQLLDMIIIFEKYAEFEENLEEFEDNIVSLIKDIGDKWITQHGMKNRTNIRIENLISVLNMHREQYAEAEAHINQSIHLANMLFGGNDMYSITCKILYAKILSQMENTEKAGSVLTQILNLDDVWETHNNLEVLNSLQNIGDIYSEMHKYPEAKKCYEDAIMKAKSMASFRLHSLYMNMQHIAALEKNHSDFLKYEKKLKKLPDQSGKLTVDQRKTVIRMSVLLMFLIGALLGLPGLLVGAFMIVSPIIIFPIHYFLIKKLISKYVPKIATRHLKEQASTLLIRAIITAWIWGLGIRFLLPLLAKLWASIR